MNYDTENHCYSFFKEEQVEEDLYNEEKRKQEKLQAFQDFVTKQIKANKNNLEIVNEKIDNIQSMMQQFLERTRGNSA